MIITIEHQEEKPTITAADSYEFVYFTPFHISILDVVLRRVELKYSEWLTSIRDAKTHASSIFTEDLHRKMLSGKHILLSASSAKRGIWSTIDFEFQKSEMNLFFIYHQAHERISYRQDTYTGPSLEFAWSPDPDQRVILITELPLQKIQFESDDSQPASIQFSFNEDAFILPDAKLNAYLVRQFSNIQDYLLGPRLVQAVVTLPSSFLLSPPVSTS